MRPDDWCLVENADFGVALMMRDSTLTEFGEIHPDKTCYTGKPPKGRTAIYSYLFTDWLQMHQPDGDSMNFTFRFAITSYANGGRGATALPGGRYCGGRGATALNILVYKNIRLQKYKNTNVIRRLK